MINEEQLNKYIGKVSHRDNEEWERNMEAERIAKAQRAERIAPFLMELSALMRKHNVEIDYDPIEFYERAIWTIDGVDHGSVFDIPTINENPAPPSDPNNSNTTAK
jgi:hypothetical protein